MQIKAILLQMSLRIEKANVDNKTSETQNIITFNFWYLPPMS